MDKLNLTDKTIFLQAFIYKALKILEQRHKEMFAGKWGVISPLSEGILIIVLHFFYGKMNNQKKIPLEALDTMTI